MSMAFAIPSYNYGGNYGGNDGGYGGDYGSSYTTSSKILIPIITKSYEEPIRETQFQRSTKITPILAKAIIAKPVITKTITPVITKSYEISEPQIISSYEGYGGNGGYGGGYGDGGYGSEGLSYGSDISYGKIISYGKGY